MLATHAEMETVLAKERLLASSLPDHILELRHGSILWQNVISLYYDLRGLCIPDLRLDTDWSSGLAGGHEFQVGVTGTISQKTYNGHKQTLVGIDNRQLPQSATEHSEQCPIVV